MSKAGPTLLMQVSDAVKAAVNPTSSHATTSVPSSKMEIYAKKKSVIPDRMGSSTRSPSLLMVVTTLGWRIRWTSRRRFLNSSTTRICLTPPAVDPAQPPANITRISTTWEKVGQST